MSERNSRLAEYKKNAGGKATTDLRRKRAELSVALRKQARDDQLQKRRALSPDPGDNVGEDKTYTPAEIVQGLKSSELSIMTIAARAGRRMLSKEQNPPITVMVEAGIVAPLVAALDRDDCSDLQFEAAWALTNIASGTRDHTMAVVNGGAIPKLITLLAQKGVVAEQAAWALGNIAGDGPETRDRVLSHGALPAILPFMVPDTPRTQLRTNVWTYSNLCRNKSPIVDFDLVAPALPYISNLLVIDDQDVLADACWALSYLTDGPNERIESVQCVPHLTERLIALLAHNAAAVKTPALRALGNMLTGTDVQTDRCLEASCLPHIISLLQSGKPSLMKEAAWAASNILAGTHAQIQQALDIGVLPVLCEVMENGEPKCQKEAAWAVTNLCLGGSPPQLDLLVGSGFLSSYCRLLASPDHRAVVLVLDGIAHLMNVLYGRLLEYPDHSAVDLAQDGITGLFHAAVKFGQVELLCMKLEDNGALDQIEILQQHENDEIYKKTVYLLDKYFTEDEEQNTPAQNENEYQFGVNSENVNPNINF